ncbi:hypothetical protein SCARD494_08808 [Seiridium cardinale]
MRRLRGWKQLSAEWDGTFRLKIHDCDILQEVTRPEPPGNEPVRLPSANPDLATTSPSQQPPHRPSFIDKSTHIHQYGHGSLARAGKVKSQTPKVEPQEKAKTPKGRAKKRLVYTRRFVNVTLTGGKRKMNPNPGT